MKFIFKMLFLILMFMLVYYMHGIKKEINLLSERVNHSLISMDVRLETIGQELRGK